MIMSYAHLNWTLTLPDASQITSLFLSFLIYKLELLIVIIHRNLCHINVDVHGRLSHLERKVTFFNKADIYGKYCWGHLSKCMNLVTKALPNYDNEFCQRFSTSGVGSANIKNEWASQPSLTLSSYTEAEQVLQWLVQTISYVYVV